MNNLAEVIVEEETMQDVLPIIKVHGRPFLAMPKDLYIPPDALEVILDAFEGPLDLLLYLIRKQNLNILDIPIAEITRQYMQYIDLMKQLRLELAAEYLVMAAILAEIKSRLLLPRPATQDNEETDPRAELVRRLQEYERFKQAAEDLHALPWLGRDVFEVNVDIPKYQAPRAHPKVELRELLFAYLDAMKRADMMAHHQIKREALSVRERMTHILSSLREQAFTSFSQFFTAVEGRSGVVVTLIAILELLKESLIEIVQNEMFSNIYIKAVGNE
jgi:segregation and condensation protein A